MYLTDVGRQSLMNKIKTAKFRSGVYRFWWEDIDGLCLSHDADKSTPPRNSDRAIWISPRMQKKGGKALMETIVHESVHADDPDLPESTVTAMAKHLTNARWRIGYRLPKTD